MEINSAFRLDSVGHRVKATRLMCRKSSAQVSLLLNISEAQYLDLEQGQSSLEKYGRLLGRLAVRLGCPVSAILAPLNLEKDAVQESCGVNLARLRNQLSLTVSDMCKACSIGKLGIIEDSSRQRSESISEDTDSVVPKQSDDCQERVLSISEKEMMLIESGTNLQFERWMTLLRAFCRVTNTDVFTLVVGT